jgi:hypothetical protein
MPSGWPAPRRRSANGSAAGRPWTSWRASSGDPEAEARAQLPEQAAQRAFQEGRAMSVEAALALVLG